MFYVNIAKLGLSSSSFLFLHHPLITRGFVSCPLKRFHNLFSCPSSATVSFSKRFMSMDKSSQQNKPENVKSVPEKIAETEALSQKCKKSSLSSTVKEYGATVIVFHVCLSLLSFGISYAVVTSGVDVINWLSWMGLKESIAESKLVSGGTTVVVAYGLYKLFSPLRVLCTLSATPFIVRYLRRKNILRTPPKA